MTPSSTSSAHEKYAKQTNLPIHFQNLMQGFHNFDHAASPSIHPFLSPTSVLKMLDDGMQDKIINVLSRIGDWSSLMDFFRGFDGVGQVVPGKDIDRMKAVLGVEGVNGGFRFQRSVDERERKELLTLLFDHCFSRKGNLPRAVIFVFKIAPNTRNISNLLSLPFTSTEETHLINYTTTAIPVSKNSATLIDSLLIYYIHHLRYIEAIRFYHEMDAQGYCKDNEWRREVVVNLELGLPKILRRILEGDVVEKKPEEEKLERIEKESEVKEKKEIFKAPLPVASSSKKGIF